MLIFSISFLIGVSQLLWLPTIIMVWLIPSLLVLAISLVFFIYTKKQHWLVLIGISLGFSFAITFAYYAKSHQLNTIADDAHWVTGKINQLPVINDERAKFALKIMTTDKDVYLKKVLVSWYNNDPVKTGQIWRFNLKLKPIHGYKNPGSFDYSKWLFRQGYDATATVKQSVLIQDKATDIGSRINVFRASIAELINYRFYNPRIQSLIKALTIGDKSQISRQDSQLFQDTGTAHLIAISGLHIGLIAFLGGMFGRIIFMLCANQKFNRFKFEAVFAISFALIYALLAGMSIPTIRALIMVTAFSLAYAFKWNISRWQAWSLAMLIVLIIDPLSVLDMGFWFSFGAVAVLMHAFLGRKSSTNKIIVFIKAQLVILVGLMPLMAIVFQQINLLTPFANFLVLPLASLLLIPLIFASMLVYLFSESMAGFLFVIIEQLSEYLFAILDFLQHFTFLTIAIGQINLITILALSAMAVILLLPQLFRWRILALVLLLPVFSIRKSHLVNAEFQLSVLDVGQGLSTVIITKNHIMVYDTGAKYESGFSLASSVVIPYLRNQGIDKIDKLILSHGDNDHAGGVNEMLLYDKNTQIFDVAGKYTDCKFPSLWKWDEVMFEVYSPFEIQPYLGNNSSCVIKISSQNGSVLLTGDIQEPIEYRLINKFPEQIKSDVLFVPHHGSKTSSSESFLIQVAPSVAINSSGFANQFNHPHPSIKQLYLDRNIEFYDTQSKGMIKLKFANEEISVQQYGDINPHFWDAQKDQR